MMNTRYKDNTFLLKSFALLLCTLISNSAMGYKQQPPMTLVLQGLVDLDAPKSVSQPYLVDGRLTGGTSFTVSPVYANRASSDWDDNRLSLISISTYELYCNSYIGESIQIPGVSGYGIPLTHTDPSLNIHAWVVPSIRYNVTITGAGAGEGANRLKTNYNGKLFTSEHDGLSDISGSGRNACLAPPRNTVTTGGGTKTVSLFADGQFKLYVDKELKPGRFRYTGKESLYVVANAASGTDDAYANINFITDLSVVRICKITEVVNDNINVTIGRDNQVIEESSFRYTCTGSNKDLAMSAIVKEGSIKTDPTKLFFDTIDGKPAQNPPWLMGMPYRAGDDSAFSCKDENKKGLLNFNNQPVDFSFKSIANITQDIRIKWAICSNDNVEPGKYRARVELAIYTKV